jgi:DNA-binding transcriptional LysR family regulator
MEFRSISMWTGAASPVLEDLDVRAMRIFVAVAEELHFTRAAARLHVTEQVLSRAIRRLEDKLGVALFVRTTRRVSLTRDGEAVLEAARELIRVNDRIVHGLWNTDRAVAVDIIDERLTSWRILQAARTAKPQLELMARHGGGLGGAIEPLLAGELDAAFGRVGGLDAPLPEALQSRILRLEPLGVLLPVDHPLADLDAIPGDRLVDQEIDISEGNTHAPEWVDLGRQFAARVAARPQPAHKTAEGLEETARHLARERLPILTHLEHPPVDGGVMRPLRDPTPLYAWSIVHRGERMLAGVAALQDAAAALARQERWLDRPSGSWLPEPEASEPTGTS